MCRHSRTGFTLIELLVVITIIVVLLALLIPAMDKAIYQAELSICATRLKTTTTTTLTYAFDNKRYYPDRTAHQSTALANLEQPARIAGIPYVDDWRSMLVKAYGDINTYLNCPLAGEVDYINATAPYVYTSYNLWFGWAYTGETRRMLKIGDRLTFRGWSSNILISDRDLVMPSVQDCQSSHPDSKQILVQEIYQDGIHPYVNQPATINWWITYENSNRGATDDNFAYDDGAVIRVNGITGAAVGGQWDRRMKNLPVFLAGTGNYSAWIYVPMN